MAEEKKEKQAPEEKEKKISRIETSFFVNSKGVVYEQAVDKDGNFFFICLDEKGKPKEWAAVGNEDEIKCPLNDKDAWQKGAILLPTATVEFGSVSELLEEIQQHIKKYLDVSDDFLIFSSYYILLSWIFDRLNTLPYLRALGDTGSGKSRFLDVVGRLCYKACMLSGAITPAPIYRMISRWHGTIILDEADRKDSSETDEVVKILNCGFETYRPVIRCSTENVDRLLIFDTYCPKVFSTRYSFKDKALESRCLTEQMTQTNRTDIPSILPRAFYEDEMVLRNKLLMFRLRFYNEIDTDKIQEIDLGDVEPRLKQATASFAVLFANIPEMMERFREFLKRYNKDLIEERQATFEAMIVNSIVDMQDDAFNGRVSAQDIADKMGDKYGMNDKPNPRTIGKFLKSLGMHTEQRKLQDGSVKRVIKWDAILMDKLVKRYVLPENQPTLKEYYPLHDTHATHDTHDTEQQEVASVARVASVSWLEPQHLKPDCLPSHVEELRRGVYGCVNCGAERAAET